MAIVRTPLTSSIGLPATALASLLSDTRVLVAGDVMLDRYWFGEVSRISPEAPVPVVQISGSEERLGGAANVARNVTALGAHATLVSKIGQDEAARCLKDLLEQAHIESRLQIDPDKPTTIKLRVLSRRQQMLRMDFEAPHHETTSLDTDQLLPLLNNHDAIVLSDYGKGTLAQPQPWISAARHLGLPVLVDPKASDFSRYAGATILKPNLSEFTRAACSRADDGNFSVRAESMRRTLGLELLLLTRSEHGMSLFDIHGEHYFPAKVREAFDVCGAGDTVGAVMITLFAAGIQGKVSAWLANQAAGIAVSRTGTTAVTMEELMASLQGGSQCRLQEIL